MKIVRNCTKLEKRKSGIYILTNTHNNCCYIGSTSRAFRLRWGNHSTLLFNNKHDNTHLQRAFNKYDCTWEFLILEIVEDSSQLFNREKYWIEKYTNENIPLYNQRGAENGRFTHSVETRLKISSSNKGQNKGINPKNLSYIQSLRKIPILEFENDKFIREYESCSEAGRILNVDYRLIHNVLKNKVKHLKLYPKKYWRYKI